MALPLFVLQKIAWDTKIHPATRKDKMKEQKNREASNRAILLTVIVFLASAVVSLLLNMLFARQS